MPGVPNWIFEWMGGSLVLNLKNRLEGKDAELIVEMLGFWLLQETQPRFGYRYLIEKSSEGRWDLMLWECKVLPWERGRGRDKVQE